MPAVFRLRHRLDLASDATSLTNLRSRFVHLWRWTATPCRPRPARARAHGRGEGAGAGAWRSL